MIPIRRSQIPDILKKNRDKWTSKFLKSKKDRPSKNQYAHPEIMAELFNMSHGKCYYCESKLGTGKDASEQVDHFVEIHLDKKLAFDWNNLYLSCPGCNHKEEIVEDCAIELPRPVQQERRSGCTPDIRRRIDQTPQRFVQRSRDDQKIWVGP